MATDLGKVGMRIRGDWSSSATYEVLDVVTYNSGLYIAKQAVPANTAPTNTTYWQAACVPTHKTAEFSYTYEQATTTGTQVTVNNAKTTIFGLTANDTIVGFSLVRALGNQNYLFNFNPVYVSSSDSFIFVPTANNSTRVTFTGVVTYR